MGAEKDSVCWTCSNVCKGCEKPVEGWAAEYRPNLYKDAGVLRRVDAWHVRWCPNYEPDERTQRKLDSEKAEREAMESKYRKIVEGDKPVGVLAYRTGLKKALIQDRINRGMTQFEAITYPYKKVLYRKNETILCIDGEEMTIRECSKRFKISQDMIHQRIRRGLTPEEAVRKPIGNYRRSVSGKNLETGEKRSFRSQAEAGSALGIDKTNISAVIRGKRKSAGGWTFWYT